VHISLTHFIPTRFFPFEFRREFGDAFSVRWSFSVDTHTLYIEKDDGILLEPGLELLPAGHVTSVNVTVTTNVLDGAAPSWFNMADAVLLNNEIMPNVVLLPLQLIRRQSPSTATIYDIVGAPTNHVSRLRPLLTIAYELNSTSPSVPKFSFPRDPYSMSPSTTLPIRHAVLSVLVPVAFAFNALLVVIQLLLARAYLLLVGVILFALSRTWSTRRLETVPKGELGQGKLTEINASDSESVQTDLESMDNIV